VCLYEWWVIVRLYVDSYHDSTKRWWDNCIKLARISKNYSGAHLTPVGFCSPSLLISLCNEWSSRPKVISFEGVSETMPVCRGLIWTAWIWSRRMGLWEDTAHICGSPSGIRWPANGYEDLIPFPSNLIRWPLANLFLLTGGWLDATQRRVYL
jgi:hypothetical protein